MAQGPTRCPRWHTLLVAALAVAVAAFLSVAVVGHGFFDLWIYHGALRHWAHDGGELYDWIRPNSRYGFTYPPFAALVLLPIAYLPWPVVVVLVVAATITAGVLLLTWLVDPISRRMRWNRRSALAVTLCLAAAFEPMRETVDFGQINVLVLLLVVADLRRPVANGRQWAGIGIGLATAIKLTPGIFVGYLLITGRWRPALAAAGTAIAATLIAAAVAPDASREFWTAALWNTDRVGELDFISNQSLRGLLARLDPPAASGWWLGLVAGTLTVWAWRTRAAVAAGEEMTGVALTGVVMCLISPVTWVHHLVWLIPALLLLVDKALRPAVSRRRRRLLLGLAIVMYTLLTSRLVWYWEYGAEGIAGLLAGNTYVWVSLALLVALPVRAADSAGRSSVTPVG
ncbi:MAG TPA: glycosyltransferase 87 family protein [Micromonosporaceae bacterium]|nr:glycosyltransferase 87 family protein [Micromonosporaceae bacterium]